MKTIVFIFVPVVIERTEINVAAKSDRTNEQLVPNKETAGDEVYPFWTWFIDNPLSPSPE